jgi:hypothetical protein
MMRTYQIESRRLSKNQSFALFYHIVVRSDLYLRAGRSRLQTSPCLVREDPRGARR